MALFTDADCRNEKKIDGLGLEKIDKSRLKLFSTMMLTGLQLYCIGKLIQNGDTSFPLQRRQKLAEKIKNNIKQMRKSLLRKDAKTFNILGLALLDYESTLNSGEGQFKLEFNKSLAKAIIYYYRDLASKDLKKLDEKYSVDSQYKEITKITSVDALGDYFQIRKSSNSLYSISEGIESILESIKGAETTTDEKRLAVQEALRLTGEYLKGTDQTPNLDDKLREQLKEKGIPVENLTKFRDMLIHKHLFSLIENERVDEIISKGLPAVKDIIDSQIVKLEREFISGIIDRNFNNIQNNSFKKIVVTNGSLDITDKRKYIPDLIVALELIKTEDSYQSLEAKDKALIDEIYENTQQMNSKRFFPSEIERVSKITFSEEKKLISSSLEEDIDTSRKIEKLREGLKNYVIKNVKGLESIQADRLKSLYNEIIDDTATEESVTEHLNKLEIQEHVSKDTIQHLKTFYSEKIKSEFNLLKTLKNSYAIKSQILNLYDIVERHDSLVSAQKKGNRKATIKKLITTRNYLSHGSALVSVEEDRALSSEIPKLLREGFITELENKDITLQAVETAIESVRLDDRLKKVLGGVEVLICGGIGLSRRRRSAIKSCLTWKEIDKFNEGGAANRDSDNIIIDSEKFISSISNELGANEERVSNFIALASESEVIGDYKDKVNMLTDNHKYLGHLKRVGKVSGMVMHGMIAKDMIGALLSGDLERLVKISGIVVVSYGSAKLAETVSEKAAGFMLKGRALLGKSLRVASPFLARGVSAYIAYDLYEQVKEYQKGNKDALVPIIGDSLQLGVDFIVIGIEIGEGLGLELLKGVSAVTGPVGMSIGAVIFVGTNIYMAVRKVEKIDEQIHLTGWERVTEGWRAFLGMQPSEEIERLIIEKGENNQAVNSTIRYLEDTPYIQRYVFPSIRVVKHDGEIILDNVVLLDQKRNDIKWSRTRPDNLAGVNLFCLPKGNWESVPTSGTYYCDGAIGVEYANNRSGNYTLIRLGDGWDRVKGFQESSNIFVLGDGHKEMTGGNEDDVFIFEEKSVNALVHREIKGTIDGGGGINTINVDGLTPHDEGSEGGGEKGKEAYIDLCRNSQSNNMFVFNYTLKDIAAIDKSEENITFSFVEEFYKREKKLDVNSSFNLTISGADKNITTYHLIDSTKIVMDQNNVYAMHNTEESIDSLVKDYSSIAERSQMYVIVHSNGEVLTIGHSHHDILMNDPKARASHLVGSSGENVFVVNPGDEKLTLAKLPISDVIIYDFDQENKIDTLDLRKVEEQLKQDIDSEINTEVSKIDSDLLINLSLDDASKKEVVKIRLKGALENNWYKRVHIVIDSIFVIEEILEDFELTPQPLIFDDNSKTIYVINPKDVVKRNKIRVKKEIGNYTFARDNDALIITNSLSSSADKNNLLTIILNDFYHEYNQDKMQTLKIEFNDKNILLRKEFERISSAGNFGELQRKVRIDSYKGVMYEIKKQKLFEAIGRNNIGDVKELINHGVSIDANNNKGQTPLHYAAKSDKLEVVKYLIEEKGANVNVKDNDGQTPLHSAANSDKLEVVKYLIEEKGANVNVKDNDGQTPLHSAAKSDKLEVVKYLVDKGANVNVKDNDGQTPLHSAAKSDKLEVVKYLIEEKGANVNVKDNDGQTPLHSAADHGKLEVVRYLIEQKGANVNVKDNDGQTPLHSAAKSDKLEVVKYLIEEKGANVNVMDNYGQTPLHSAADHGKLEVVRYLIEEKNANIDVKDNYEQTPLHFAAINGKLEVVRYLIVEKNANMHVKDNNGQTPLHSAADHGKLEVVRYLIEEKNANIDVKDNYGQTPLHFAAINGKLEVVRYLIEEKNANINVKDNNGQTPLHSAADYGKLEVVRYLIEEKNANINVKDNEGQTPLHHAADHGKLEVVKYLIEKKGVDFNVKNKYSSGYTPLYFAAESDNLKVVKYLIERGAKIDLKVNDEVPLDILERRGHRSLADSIIKELTKRLFDAVKYDDFGEVQCLINQGVSVKVKDSDGQTLLQCAVSNGKLKVVQYLVEKGADVTERNGSGDAPLHYATKSDKLEVVQYLVEKGADVNVKDNSGRTPLHYAADHGTLEVVRYLIEEINGNINVKDNNGQTPLHFAAKSDKLEVVKYLIEEKGANVNVKDNDGQTPLHTAADHGKLEVVRYLIEEKGANIYVKDNYGQTPLHSAADHGKLEVVRYLLEEKNANINVTDNNGQTPLHSAAQSDKLEVIKYLIEEEGANVNVKDNSGQTPLHFAADHGKLEIVKYLVEKGANVNVKDNDGQTPSHSAAKSDKLEVVKYLIEQKGANVNVKDNDGQIPLHYAADHGKLEVVRYLIEEKGANIYVKDNYGQTPLHSAADHGMLEVVRYLIEEKNANINVKDNYGQTPLHSAADHGMLEVVRYLIEEKNANINVKDNNGQTPLHSAADHGELEVVRYLIEEKNANINGKDNDGQTPLHSAADHGMLEVVRYLIEEKNANINGKDNDGQTPLHSAVDHGKLEVVRYLIEEKNANIDVKNNYGETPLHFAAIIGKLDVVKYLIEKGAKIDLKVNDEVPLEVLERRGHSSLADSIIKELTERLFDAVKYNDFGEVEGLINQGVSVKVKDTNGQTLLQCAVINGKLKVVKYVVEQGADVNVKDSYGRTALYFAAMTNKLEVVKYLVEKGADVNVKDHFDGTPLRSAVINSQLGIVKFLVEKGADINVTNDIGQTPLDLATHNRHSGVVEYLKRKHNEEREKHQQRKRRHHHGDRNRHHSLRRPLTIDSSNQPEIATSNASQKSSWINDLVGWVKNSIGGLVGSRAALPETSANYSNTAKNPGNQYTSQFISEVCINNNVGLGFFLLQRFLDKKYPLPKFCSFTYEEALANTLNIIGEFEKTLEKTAKQSGVFIKDVNFFKVYLDMADHVWNESYSQIPNILYSAAKEACPKNEKFLSILKGNIEKMLDRQQTVNSNNQEQGIANVDNKIPPFLLNSIVVEPANNKGLKGVTCAG
ncbi:uncharacterized protein LOC143211701 isoform X2 [Lasioglossum baleicum]|uniref:uncharacterized protein LOC143211701 isoform X2 n=1 Tax=Lasioglossum baleicum TaxID=434251 RepID=UPI003FCCB8EA